jgi:predicted nucleotidyltransferase
MGPYDSYIQGWRERARQDEERRRALEAKARSLLPSLVGHLVRQHGARRVVLIGSLFDGVFREASDIDLAVEGIPGAALYRAAAELEDLARPFRVDLIPIEDASPDVRRKIETKGQVLHDG